MTEESTIDNIVDRIDDLIGQDDGEMLAAIAKYKVDILNVIGGDGIVSILREIVDKSDVIKYFSKRSRKEIDSIRPEVNLKVLDELAWLKYPALASKSIIAGYSNLAALQANNPAASNRLASFKSEVLFEEVCRPFGSKVAELMSPHWEKTKRFMEDKNVDADKIALIIYSLFVIRVAPEYSPVSDDRMCTTSMFL